MEANFKRISTIGTHDGSVTRLAFSDADWETRSVIRQMMEKVGLIMRVDAFGNLIGRREGKNPQAPVVMLGSHIDSVPHGGNFDGIAGVLGAIEVVYCLNEMGYENYYPIEVVVFMAEESSRFGAATLGSRAFCGELSFDNLNQYKDKCGVTLAQAMKKRGIVPENISQAYYAGKVKAFLELHIEQGKVLETARNKIGIVTGIAAPTRLRIVIAGEADHSGATPMNMRKDALTAAAEIILKVEELAGREADNGSVGTTGIVKAEPGVMNVIPGRVELGIDIRGIVAESKQRIVRNLIDMSKCITSRRNVKVEVTTLVDEKPVSLSNNIICMLEGICQELTYPSMLMPSGAGHDAMHLASIAETGMIFIPCRGGISHNPAEWASIDDIVAGTNVLLAAIHKLAERRP